MLVNNISSLIVQKGYIDEKRIKSESEKYLFMLCFILAYSFIAFTSESVCNQNLSETFKDIIDKNAKLSYSLLDIAIKLDYAKGSGIPFNDLEILMTKLVSREKTNIKGELTDRRVIHSNLPYRVLVQLVQDYCNLYPVSENDEQRLSSLFDVSMHDQNVNKFLYLKRGGK